MQTGKHLLSRGTRQPAFKGMSTLSMARMQYITAEWTTETGALRFPRTSHPVPSKSNKAEPSSSFISTRRQICDSTDGFELLPPHVTVENIQGNHHPDNRLHSRCWYRAS